MGNDGHNHINVFWFRRDLRLDDNAALYKALRGELPVLPLFIFDKTILDQLENKADARVNFIYRSLKELQQQLTNLKSSLNIRHGYPIEVFEDLVNDFEIKNVFTNHDYEPYARERDEEVMQFLQSKGIAFHTYKDQVIFDKNEIIKGDGSPYTVFTPYSKKWKSALSDHNISSFPTEKYFSNFLRIEPIQIPTLDSIGFEEHEYDFPSSDVEEQAIIQYHLQRDYPGISGTSRIGVHLRFGTVSIRKLVRKAMSVNETYLNELIWREFYQMILWHFPQVGKGKAFKKQYDAIQWRNNEEEFRLWCEGRTGYPIVDAGMRELNTTGFMHNRVRMIVASFLTKHLLIDWRWGEAYFAEKLLDFELASNNGGWQWAAGSGCDAAPYFRIFNPYTQTKKFDPKLEYVSKWVPEFQEFSYPKPIVEHDYARQRCLEVYNKALKPS